jgi:hypothetical protein
MSRVTQRVALAAALLAAGVLRGQTTGSIEGRLIDSEGGTLANVLLTATSPQLQGSRAAVSDRLGHFRIPAVPPGEYHVRAERQGFRAAERSATVRLDATASVDFVLEPLVTEEVQVSGKAPAIDFASTTTGTSYTGSVISQLPVGRNYADIVRSNPGVSTDRGDTQGRSLALTVYGATSAENQWIIDGVNTTNVFNGVQGKTINNEFIQEVEVKTGGYQPEYGRALGGVVNVITKSGGNEFHGDGFVYFDSTQTAAERQFRAGDSTIASMRVADGSRVDYGFDLGGFILKDRLWIFGAFNRVQLRAHLSRVKSSTYVSSEDRFPFDGTEDLYSAKLTWNAAPSTTVVGTVFADPSTTSGAAGADPRQGLSDIFVDPIVSPERSTWFSARKQGGTDFGVRMSRLFGSRAIATLQGAYHQQKNKLDAPDGVRYEDWTCEGGTPVAPCAPPDEPHNITGGYGRISGLLDGGESSRQQYLGNVTFYAGAHEVKAGADYLEGRTRTHGFPTGGQFVEIFSEFGEIYYAHHFPAAGPNDPTIPSIERRGRVKDFGGYLQDSWKAAPGLTINAGLRWDGEDTLDYRGMVVLRLRTAWQPRIGVVWDPWRDGATKVFAFAGRFSYALPTVQTALAFAKFTLFTTYNFDAVSVVHDSSVINRSDPEIVGGAFADAVDSDVVAPYQDELTVGVERSLGSSLTVGLKGTYRRLGAALENRCDFDNGEELYCAIITPGSSGGLARGESATCNGFDDPWFDCPETVSAAPAAKRVYRGIEVFGRHSVADRLWIQASYVYSSLRGNYDGGINQLSGLTVPGRNGDYDYPPLWQNGYGRLFLDRPHRFRLDGFWTTPWRLSVGLQTFVESGAPLSKMGYFNGNYGAMVYLTSRGSEGRLPTLWDANLTLGYPIKIGPVKMTLQAYLFNLFNNQIDTSRDEAWSDYAFDGYPARIYDPNQERTNDLYGAVTGRSEPRSFRAALRISF